MSLPASIGGAETPPRPSPSVLASESTGDSSPAGSDNSASSMPSAGSPQADENTVASSIPIPSSSSPFMSTPHSVHNPILDLSPSYGASEHTVLQHTADAEQALRSYQAPTVAQDTQVASGLHMSPTPSLAASCPALLSTPSALMPLRRRPSIPQDDPFRNPVQPSALSHLEEVKRFSGLNELDARRRELEAEVEERLEKAAAENKALSTGTPDPMDPEAEGAVVFDTEKLDRLLHGEEEENTDTSPQTPSASDCATSSPFLEYETFAGDFSMSSTPPHVDTDASICSPDLTPISDSFVPSTPTRLPSTLHRRASSPTGSRMTSSSYSPNTFDTTPTGSPSPERHVRFAAAPLIPETPFAKTLKYFKQYKGKENSPSKSRRNASLPDELAEMARDAGLELIQGEENNTDGLNDEDDNESSSEAEKEEDLERYREMDLAPIDSVMEDHIAGDLIMLATPTPSRVHDWMNANGTRKGASDVMEKVDEEYVEENEQEDGTPAKPASSIKPDAKIVSPRVTDSQSRAKPQQEQNDQQVVHEDRPDFSKIIGMLPATLFWAVASPVAALSNKAYDKVVEKLFGMSL